jgi:arylsulfatase A-like enzyme
MQINRRTFLQTLCGGFAAACADAARPVAPNILFILLDDMGWRDTGCYGNRFIDTPNIDRLASQSARFSNAYAACPVCSPTRASILTGKYPARLHLTDWIPGRKQWPFHKVIPPEFLQQLPLEETTLARALKPGHYRSAAIGKWHLGGEGHLPIDHGFDVNIGGSSNGSTTHYFGPLEMPGLKLDPGEFLTQRLTDEGVRFMRVGQPPFFLYQAHYTVHLPLEAQQESIEKYKRRDIGDSDPAYCAMVESADQSVGQLLQALDESGQADRTVVIFFSDNGGVRYQARNKKPVTNNSQLRAGKGHLYEGGIREPLLIRWPNVTRPGQVIDTAVSSIDFFPTLCAAIRASHGRVDGVDISPLLKGRSIANRPLFWHYPHYSHQGGRPAGAVRDGDWKLIEFFEDRLELYNLRDDPGERRNLVRKESVRAIKLHDVLKDWRESVRASMPRENQGYDPAKESEGLTGDEPPTPLLS